MCGGRGSSLWCGLRLQGVLGPSPQRQLQTQWLDELCCRALLGHAVDARRPPAVCVVSLRHNIVRDRQPRARVADKDHLLYRTQRTGMVQVQRNKAQRASYPAYLVPSRKASYGAPAAAAATAPPPVPRGGDATAVLLPSLAAPCRTVSLPCGDNGNGNGNGSGSPPDLLIRAPRSSQLDPSLSSPSELSRSSRGRGGASGRAKVPGCC